MKIHFITPVWGEKHTKIFIDILLPSLLSPKNIPNLLNLSEYTYYIYTDETDAIKIQESIEYRHLQSLISVKISLIEEKFKNKNPYIMMSNCHRIGLNIATKLNAGAIFIPPDSIWADGSIKNLQNIISSGVTAIHMSMLRIEKNATFKFVTNVKQQNNNIYLQITPRDLVKLSLPHLHSITHDHFFKEENDHGIGLIPSNLLWDVNNQGILARCFHLHPIYVKLNKYTQFKSTIDDDLMLLLKENIKTHYIVTDSDEICAFEISPFSHQINPPCKKQSVSNIARWALHNTNNYHRKLINTTIRIHHTTINKKIWAPVEKQAENTINQYKFLFFLYRFLAIKRIHKILSICKSIFYKIYNLLYYEYNKYISKAKKL